MDFEKEKNESCNLNVNSSNKEDSESSYSPEIEEVDYSSIAYEKPASFCSMYNFIKVFMRFCMN